MPSDLADLVRDLGQPRVLVVGDVMLDRYVWGDAERSFCCTPTSAKSGSAALAAWLRFCAP